MAPAQVRLNQHRVKQVFHALIGPDVLGPAPEPEAGRRRAG
jgi:hypothetical protein